jgi:hypothetical protein
MSLLALALVAPVWAQQTEEEIGEPEIRRYTVEMIVFRYAQDVSVGSEQFRPDEPEPAPEFSEPMAIVDPEPAEPADEPGPLPDMEFTLLAREDYQLVETYQRMRRLDVYEPVMHFGWTQATWPEEQTDPIPLHRFARPPADMDGTLTLYLSRFLHLVVDLSVKLPDVAGVSGDDIDRRSRSRTVGDLLSTMEQDGRSPMPTYYRIQEDRIFKNGDLRYFDHPKFGVLAKITRVEETEEDQSSNGELLGYGPE